MANSQQIHKQLASLELLNNGSRADFFHSVNLLFETAPPLADSLFAKRPFSTYEALISTAKDLVARMSLEDKLKVINAHPRIGAPPAQLSAQSYKEQGYDKDGAAQQEKLKKVLEELAVLNDEYEKKFGFRFVVFVAGRPRDAILPVIRERMNNTRDQELATGLSEMMAIASDRLKKFLSEAPAVYVSERVVLPDGVKPAAVHVKAGKIVAITPRSEFLATHRETPYQGTFVDFGDRVLMPGVVDSHVHVNEPGRTEWEGFRTATMAAIAGGVTTIVDMPLNSSPVTTSLSALRTKIAATADTASSSSPRHDSSSSSKLFADTALLGGVVPSNRSELAAMISAGGVVGFKCFMIHSGLDEFPHVVEHDIRDALEEIHKSNSNVVMMFHAEVEGPIFAIRDQLISLNPKKYSSFLKSRPRECENQAIALVIKLAREFQVRCHVVHLASSDALEQIRVARAEGVPITAETTYHYLHFTAEQIADSKTLLKCCPPIRERENRERLWQAVKDGTISLVVSDHSPCTPELKQGDFNSSWGGISSLQLGLPIIWSQCKSRGYSLNDLAKWMCENTADLIRLGNRKGRLAVGFDADFCVWSPDESFVVNSQNLYVKNAQNSAYAGETLYGVVYETYLSGVKVYDVNNPKDKFCAPGSGKLLLHGVRIDPSTAMKKD